MKTFISWSGPKSLAVAELLKRWVRCVLQATRPWISSDGIERGATWFNELQSQLGDCSVGIVCLTLANREQPWILFEAGALAKGLSKNRVCTFLIDLNPSDVEDPLAQFNHTLPDKASVRQLVETLNKALPESERLNAEVMDQTFNAFWPQFETDFAAILQNVADSEKGTHRSKDDILAEILQNTRSTQAMIANLKKAPESALVADAVRRREAADAIRHGKKGQDARSLISQIAEMLNEQTRSESAIGEWQPLPGAKTSGITE